MPGFKTGRVAFGTTEDFLFSTVGLTRQSAVISKNARDAGNPNGSTILRAGLLLGLASSGTDDGMYLQFDSTATDGTEESANVVVLGHDVDLSAAYGDDPGVQAAVYIVGVFKSSGILGDFANLTKDEVQRLTFR